MKPKVPGSWNTGSRISGISSPARCASAAAAPTKVRERVATKKKRWIFGGSPSVDRGPATLAQCGRRSSSICRAMSKVVPRL